MAEMNPNQPPNYPPGQYPHYPPMYPGMPPQHHFMPQTTPQYPQPPFMNMQIKQEPVWCQDGRYGMPGPSAVQNQFAGHQMHPSGMPMPGIEIGRDARESTGGYPNPSGSLLAQHLASGPPHPSQTPSHLHQLLQQPVYPQGPMQNMHMQQQMAEQQRMAQIQAMRQQQHQQQQQQHHQAQHHLHQQQQQQQHHQQQHQAYLEAQQQQAKANYQQAEQTAFPPSASSTQSAYSQQRAQEMNPAPQPVPEPLLRPTPKTRKDFESLTTGELCILGRELVSDLNSKTSQLSQMLKKVMERKTLNQGENPNDLSDQCRQNLEKMSIIRQLIEKRRTPEWKRMSGDDYIELMLDDSEIGKNENGEEAGEAQKEKREELVQRVPTILSKTPPNEGDIWYQGRWIPNGLYLKYMRFEDNKEKLKVLANQLKNLAWKIEVTSPGHLKKVDQTKISKKREDPL